MTERLNVLVVDDSVNMRMLLAGLLTAAGHHVVTASAAREALRRLRVFRPDVVVTDYAMPGLSGYDLVRLLRRNPRFRTTPVFVVSSENSWEKHLLMEQAGASAWLSKPVDPAALLGAIAAVGRMGRDLPGAPVGRPAMTTVSGGAAAA